MRLFSASEYEFGLIAVGPTPIGVVALGLAPERGSDYLRGIVD